MSESVLTEMVFVKDECGTLGVKEEPPEEEDPLNLKKGKSLLQLIAYTFIFVGSPIPSLAFTQTQKTFNKMAKTQKQGWGAGKFFSGSGSGS